MTSKPSDHRALYRTPYGYFDCDTDEYVVTDPHTPLPWVNVICPGQYGVVLSATGDGFCWYGHAGLNMITRWLQDFARQEYGRFLYLRCEEDGEIWSASYSPCKRASPEYRAAHGAGYTRFVQDHHGIESQWWITVDPKHQVEVWELRLHNSSDRMRRLSVMPFVEWCLGAAHAHHRQIHECFLETACEGDTATATRSMWEVPSDHGHWNADYPYVAFLAASQEPAGWQLSKRAFLGPEGRIGRPRPTFHRRAGSVAGSNDAACAMELRVDLDPGETRRMYFSLGLVREREAIAELRAELLHPVGFDAVRARVRDFWQELFSGFELQSPEPSLDLLVNHWLKYQVFSSRIFGRCGYSIQGGAFGYREIQDLLLVIGLQPDLARERLLLYAQNQYADLSVPHWFDPLTRQRVPAAMRAPRPSTRTRPVQKEKGRTRGRPSIS